MAEGDGLLGLKPSPPTRGRFVARFLYLAEREKIGKAFFVVFFRLYLSLIFNNLTLTNSAIIFMGFSKTAQIDPVFVGLVVGRVFVGSGSRFYA